MTIAVTAFKSLDGRLYETESQSHKADRDHLYWNNRFKIEAVLGVDKHSGREAHNVVCRVIERWDELKKVVENVG